MISRTTVNRRFDLLNEAKRLIREMPLFDQITGETDEVRREIVNRAYDFGRIGRITLVMKIAEVNEATFAFGIEFEMCDAQRGRLNEVSVKPEHARNCQHSNLQKFATRHANHLPRSSITHSPLQ